MQLVVALHKLILVSNLMRYRETRSSMSIDLQCFVKEGIDFTGLVVPFEIGTKGKASVSVADIQFTPDSAEQAVISCQ